MIELHRSGHFPLEDLCTYYDVHDFEKAMDDVLKGNVSVSVPIGRYLAADNCSRLLKLS